MMGRKSKQSAIPNFTAFVSDESEDGKLTRIGETQSFKSNKGFTFHVDDNPRAKQLAYEHLERIVFLKN